MKKVNIFSNGYYKYNRILMTVIGIWPETSIWLKIFIRSTVFVLLLSIMIPQYAFLVRKCRNMDDTISGIIAQLSIIVGLVKYSFIVINMKRIRMTLDKIREDWISFEESPAIETIHNYAARGCFGTKFYIAFIFSIASFFSVAPLKQVILDIILPLNESRQKIFMLDTDYSIYGIDANEQYFLTLMHSYFTSMMVMNMVVTGDTFVLIIVEHCCGLFEAVGTILKQTELDLPLHQQYRIICNAVAVHHRAISLAEFVESSFNMMYAFLVLISMALICITGLESIIKIDDLAEVARFVTFGVGQMIHLLFMSFPGQELLDHSTRVSERVYSCNWSGISTDGKKLISIMLMRSMKPLRMTAGGFYLLNIENYGNVLRTSFSYFTVLLSTR